MADSRVPSRLPLLVYAAVAYLLFVAAAAWGIGFLAAWGAPTSVDGPTRLPAVAALVVDALLLLAFALHHSVLARPAVKRRLARVVPPQVERSTFVLVASLLLMLTFAFWQPVPTVVWEVGAPWSTLLWATYAVGWVIVVASTFMVDHADFLGLKQAVSHVLGTRHAPPEFTQRWLYRWVRHPMMFGLLVAFWATPRMSVGHLAFALLGTGYIVVGTRLEEHDLRAEIGEPYVEYASRVPSLVMRPRSRPRRSGPEHLRPRGTGHPVGRTAS